MSTEIRRIAPGQPGYEAAKRLRYAVYADEERLDIAGMEPTTRTMADQLDDVSVIFGAFDGNELTASIRMTPVDALPADSDQRELFGTAQFELPESKMFVAGRLMVDSHRRGSMACNRLLSAVYEHAVRNGFEIGLLLCRPRQLPMYESVGCRRYRNAVGHEQFGLLVPMVHLLRDLEHAAKVPAPLRSPALTVPHNGDLAAWFESRFGETARPCSVKLMSEHEARRLDCDMAASRCVLFAGIAAQDRQWVLKSSALLELPAGTRILPRGSRGSELYVLLDGQVVVLPPAARETAAVTLLNPGQVFAEGGFLWKGAYASGHEVRALGQVRLLSINADVLGASRFVRPEVAASFFAGLSRALSERLHALDGAGRHLPVPTPAATPARTATLRSRLVRRSLPAPARLRRPSR